MKAHTLLALLLLAACGDRDGGDKEDSTPTDDSSGGGGDDSTATGDDSTADDSGAPPEPVAARITGTVTVSLYTTDADGERTYVSWTEADALTDYDLTQWPFGKLFVATYSEDSTTGARSFWGDATVDSPSSAGNPYELAVQKEDGPGDVYVYAQLDWYPDRVIGTDEPQAFYGALVPITDGAEITGVDIDVLAPIPGGLGWGGGPGGSGGDGSDPVTITGDVLITVSYADGDVATFLQTTGGEGPYWVSWATPTPDGGGATTPYTVTTSGNLGTCVLRGAWDTNGNDLIEATDRWGAYISSPDTSGNPITLGSTDLEGYDIQIPLGGEEGFELVPFTRLSGTVAMDAGVNFDEPEADGGLPVGSTVYVTALKYRPSHEVTVSTLGLYAYATETWTWADLSGQSSRTFNLNVPADTVVYLWAFADHDGDGLLNEPSGEAVASYGTDSSGKIPTGSTGASGLALTLRSPTAGE